MIDLLIEHPYGITIDDISNRLSVSKSTTQRDIELINSTYKDFIHIKTDLNKLFLINSNTEELIYIQYLILNESINLKILAELFFYPFNKITYFSNKFNISTSNIYKIIKTINQTLSSYQIEIVNANNKYYIKAFSEITLRRLFSVCWVELNYFSNNLTKQIDLVDSINLYINEIIKNVFDIDIKFIESYNTSFIYISFIRESQLFFLEGESISTSKNNDQIASTIIKSLLYSPFDNNPFFYNRKLFQLKKYLHDNLEDKDKVELLYNCLVVIYKNECSDQIPPSVLIDKYKSFYLSLKEKHNLYQPIIDLLDIFSNILNIDLKDYYHVLSYLIIIYFPEILSKNNKNTVYVYSNLSTSHAFFLQKVLMDKFNNLYEFIIVKDKHFIEDNQKKYLFVTNENKIISKNNFVINDFPKKIDLVNLELKLTNFYYSKKN